MKLTDLYQACRDHVKVFPKGNLVLGLKPSRQKSEYRKFLNGPRGVVIFRTKTQDFVSFKTQAILLHCEKKLQAVTSCGINPYGPSFDLDVQLINRDLLKQSKATTQNQLMDNLVSPAELDSNVKTLLESGPFSALGLANLIWGSAYLTPQEIPSELNSAWASIQAQLIARVRRRLLILKDSLYYKPLNPHEPPHL
jgi:hypothetical protein